MTEKLDQDLPEGFMEKLVARLREEDKRWSPVTEVRMYPFFVSYIHANMIESVLMRGAERGLFKVETRYWHGQGPNVPPAAYRVFIPLPEEPERPKGCPKCGYAHPPDGMCV